MNQIKTIVQAVHFILSRTGQSDKLKIVKLMFLADKYHLQMFGRTITGDNFIAMKNGPVGSTTKDVLDFDMDWIEPAQFAYVDKCLERRGDFDYIAKSSGPAEYEMLSETDRKSLSAIIDRFGNLDHGSLINITHRLSEWAQHENDLNAGVKKSVPIDTDELFSQIPDDPLNVPAAIVEKSRAMYNGLLC